MPASAKAVLAPGVSIGPFRLGMSSAELDAAAPSARMPGQIVVTTGPYQLMLDDRGDVVSVYRRLASNIDGTRLTEPLLIGGAEVPTSITFDELRKRVPGCGAPEEMVGGTVASCAEHTQVTNSLGGVAIVVSAR